MAVKQDPQARAIKVLVELIKSHQGLLGLVSSNLSCPVNLGAADKAIDAAGKLLNDLRLGEVKVTRWSPNSDVWCAECGNNWEPDPDNDEGCPECGGKCTDG